MKIGKRKKKDRMNAAIVQMLNTILYPDQRKYIHPELRQSLILSLLDLAEACGDDTVMKRVVSEYL